MNVKRIYIVLDLSLLRGGDREEHLGRFVRVVSRTWLHCAGQNDDVSFGFTLYDSDVGGYMLSYQMNMVAQGLGIPKNVAATSGSDLNGNDLVNFLTLIKLVTDKQVMDELKLRTSRNSRSSDIPAVETCKVLRTVMKTSYMQKIACKDSSSSTDESSGLLLMFTPSLGSQEGLHGYVGKECLERFGTVAAAFMHHLPKAMWKSMASYNMACTWICGNTVDEVSDMFSQIHKEVSLLFSRFSLVSIDTVSAEDISREDFVRRIGLRVEEEVTSSQPAEGQLDDLWEKTAPQTSLEQLQAILVGVLPQRSPFKGGSKISALAGGRRRRSGRKAHVDRKKEPLVGRGQKALKHARVVGQKASESEQKGHQNTCSTVNQGNPAIVDVATLENISPVSVEDAIRSAREHVSMLKDSSVSKVQSGQDDMKTASDALQAINMLAARTFYGVDKHTKQCGSAMDMDDCRRQCMDSIPIPVKSIQELHKSTKFERKYEVVWTAAIQILLRFSLGTFVRKEDERPEGLSAQQFESIEDMMHILIATMSPIPSQGQRFFLEILKPAFSPVAKEDIMALERSIWDEEDIAMEGDGSLSEHRLAAVSLEESGETPGDSAEELEREKQDDELPHDAKSFGVDRALRKVKSYNEQSVSTSQGPAASADGSGIHGTSSRGIAAASGPRSRVTSSNLMSRRFNNSKQFKMQVKANPNKLKKRDPPKRKDTKESEKKAARKATKEQVPDTPLLKKQGDETTCEQHEKICTTPNMLDAKDGADVIPNTSPREQGSKQSPAKRIGSIRQPLFDDVAPGVILPNSEPEKKQMEEPLKVPSNTWLSGAIIRRKRTCTDSGASRLADMQTTIPSTGFHKQETDDMNKEITSPLKIRKNKHVDEPPATEPSAMMDPAKSAGKVELQDGRDNQNANVDARENDIEIVLSPACTDAMNPPPEECGQGEDMSDHDAAEDDSGLFKVNSDIQHNFNDDSMAARNQCTSQGCSSSHLHGDDDEGITSPAAGCAGKENRGDQTPRKGAHTVSDELVKNISPLEKSNECNKKAPKKRSGRLAKMLAGPMATKQTPPSAAYAKRTTPSPKKKIGITVEDRGSPCKASPGSGSKGSWARQQDYSGPPDYSSDTDSCIGDSPDAVVAMKPLIQPTPGDVSDEEDAAILNAAATGSLSPVENQNNSAVTLPRRKRRRSLLAVARCMNDPEPLKKAKNKRDTMKKDDKTPIADETQTRSEPKQQLHLTDGAAPAKKAKRKSTKPKKMPLEKDEIICFVPFHGGRHQVHCVIETIEQAQLTRKGWVCTVLARPMDEADGLEPATVKLDSSKEVTVGSPLQDAAAWCRVDSNSPRGATILQHTFSATVAHNEAVKNAGKISPQDSITVLKKSEKNSRVVFSPPRRQLDPCHLQYSGQALASAEKIQNTPPLGNHTKSNMGDISGIELFPERPQASQKVSPEARAAAGEMLGALYAGRNPLCSTTIDKVLGSPMGSPDKF
ncbi:hypothetical protein M9435_003692 [Picochlorum sp. BPE23]|nr:hypothetical protein M9435_003692 [Picochlorum sp. BPE23]